MGPIGAWPYDLGQWCYDVGMPELPEVETIRRDLEKEVVGLSVVGLDSTWERRVLPSLDVVQKDVVNKKITSITRLAKILSINLEDGLPREDRLHLLIHLKLTGQLLLRQKSDKTDPFVHHKLLLSDGREIRFADSRKFGYIKLASDEDVETLQSALGKEPLDVSFNVLDAQKLLERRGSPIKTVLLDQTIFAGVGNIYANDALFLAGINPKRPSKSLSEPELQCLLTCLKDVLNESLKARGASDNTYIDLYGQKGGYQNHFKVYGRKGLPCLNQCGENVQYIKLNQRGTFYCARCQS